MVLKLLHIKPMARVVSALDVEMFIGGFTPIDMGDKIFGLHDMRGIEWALGSGYLLESFIVI